MLLPSPCCLPRVCRCSSRNPSRQATADRAGEGAAAATVAAAATAAAAALAGALVGRRGGAASVAGAGEVMATQTLTAIPRWRTPVAAMDTEAGAGGVVAAAATQGSATPAGAATCAHTWKSHQVSVIATLTRYGLVINM